MLKKFLNKADFAPEKAEILRLCYAGNGRPGMAAEKTLRKKKLKLCKWSNSVTDYRMNLFKFVVNLTKDDKHARTMRKLIFAISAFITLSGVILAAPVTQKKAAVTEIPDLEQIRREVNDPSSPFYYPNLMGRYQQNETVMDLNDYRHLYYGYLFQEDFNPYRHNEALKKNENLYYKNNHTRAELDSIITYAETALDDNPFDLSQMNFLIYALRARGKVNRANIWQYRLNHLVQAIISSGTGADSSHAWYVINPRHEYDIVNFQDAVVKSQHYEEPYFDLIEVEKKDPKGKTTMETYYFNVKNLLEEYYRKFPEEE